MKFAVRILLVLVFHGSVQAQSDLDSMRSAVANAPDGALKFAAVRSLYNYYEERNKDSALYYSDVSLSIAKNHSVKIPEAFSLARKAYQLIGLGRYAEALESLQNAFAITENSQLKTGEDWDLTVLHFSGSKRLLALSFTHQVFALLMVMTENLQQQIIHFKEARRIGKQINYPIRVMLADMNLGVSYLSLNKLDSALFFTKLAEEETLRSNFHKFLSTVYQNMSDIYNAKGEHLLALEYSYLALQTALEQKNLSTLSRIYLRLTKHHLEKKNKDSALFFALKNIQTIQTLGMVAGPENNLGIGYEYLALSYKHNNQVDSTLKYQELALITKDSLNNSRSNNLAAFQSLIFNEQLRLQHIEKEKLLLKNKIRTYSLSGGVAVLLLLSIIFYRNNRQQKKAKIKIEKAYDRLKSTQSQLIQSEKMASLGELTAGIAHEIQNPLNFVNNFSEVNSELIEELKSELATGNTQQAIAIADDIKDNEQKIIHHGKRADGIVKGMLQHSRNNSGQKVATDINALADEYLRLAYHGLRAKDNTFNASLITDYDTSIGEISIVPQDMGRVILNLITNAMYAVNERSKKIKASGSNSYEPSITVKTKKSGNTIQINIKDNGGGIPQQVIDKIFQPFFTTKPAGEGTGLGLSLSYDIVKAHGGVLKVNSEEGKGSEFIVELKP